MFDAVSFIKRSEDKIKNQIGEEKALCAISGGVDSTVCAVLVSKAIGSSLRTVFIDTGFMREGEPEWVKQKLEEMEIDLRVVDAKERFISAVEGMSDAEDKRKAFRNTFYNLFGEIVREEGRKILIQGTIAPDWIETKGGIKSQHNVLSQIGIDPEKEFGYKVVEPILQLYKDQVRLVGKELGLPEGFYTRQPFPGPGLIVRVVGEIKRDKLEDTRTAVSVVEKHLSDISPQQYFAALLEGDGDVSEKMSVEATEFLEQKAETVVLQAKGTGVTGDLRRYGNIALLSSSPAPDFNKLTKTQFELVSRNKELSRVLFKISEREEGTYICALRAINTRDFMTAYATEIPKETLDKIADEILEKCTSVKAVGYDITPKPPATVEYE